MLSPAALRRPLAAAARLARGNPQVFASLATGPRQDNGIFYEIRTYDVKPSKMKEFVELVHKFLHLRTAHSELVGYWTTELGAMNKAVHVWKYDNFAHRTAVRHALANDKEWQGQFISSALPLIEKQHNEVAYLVPWCQLGKPPKEGGVYEWVTFQMKPGGPALWGEAFQAAINAHINTGYTKLIGVFHTEYGLLNTVHVIWWNESPDHRAAGRHRAHEDARVVAAVRDSVRFLESQKNMLLTPLAFSPLK
ncbi:protein NipSnap homolog 3A-like [Coturnix japonica]|uniref:Protein NipSnap homolog 3A-like n=1 Tax=Coturnix japonica TaxID=93934 RepID=A0A8C2TMI9_COTJA|nr:protein NipSnap homolog 3A-like [Coturnix japonica]